MPQPTKIVWREWFNKAAVAKMTEMGTLPRRETYIDTRFSDGCGIAEEIAKSANNEDYEMFAKSGDVLVILEPEEFAGAYQIEVDFDPNFTAITHEADLE
jgi:hypothetical protein